MKNETRYQELIFKFSTMLLTFLVKPEHPKYSSQVQGYSQNGRSSSLKKVKVQAFASFNLIDKNAIVYFTSYSIMLDNIRFYFFYFFFRCKCHKATLGLNIAITFKNGRKWKMSSI